MSFLQVVAIIFGIVFLLVGIAGFVPQFIQNGLLLGIFEVNDAHNLVHLGTGVVALLSSVKTICARYFFCIFGIIYAVVAIVGFVNQGDLIVMHTNFADNVLHAVIAVVSLYLGFLTPKARDE